MHVSARDPVWLARYVIAPDRILASGDPIARKLFAKYKKVPMPNLSLSADDLQAILPYVAEQARAATSNATSER